MNRSLTNISAIGRRLRAANALEGNGNAQVTGTLST